MFIGKTAKAVALILLMPVALLILVIAAQVRRAFSLN